MKQLKSYLDKVEQAVAASTSRKQRGAGLFATTKQQQAKPSTDIDTIAAFVVGIRKAKEEVLNGNA